MRILHGDCLTLIPTLADASIDGVLTDPPGGLGIMGRAWDSDRGGRDHWIAWMTQVAAECWRSTKPGGHALVWATPRTSHWTAMAWESGGWEVRDRLAHLFGNGYPKSLDIGKAADAITLFGGCDARRLRQVNEIRPGEGRRRSSTRRNGILGTQLGQPKITRDQPATAAGQACDGWHTALRPACEDWWLFRRPITESSVAANMLRHGVGGLHIGPLRSAMPANRWPANVLLDGSDEILEALPEAARTFFCAKAGAADRGGSNHPCIKPLRLMEFLATLICPPGGVLLDPFAGSGSTGQAALNCGFDSILIEAESEYIGEMQRRFAAV